MTFAGRVDPHQMAEYYASHDIYVQSPNIDNMPTSVIEAFACGLPVVSTNAGGIPAHGNQRSEWDAGCRFDFPNPEYR